MKTESNQASSDTRQFRYLPKHSAGLIGFCGGVIGLLCSTRALGRDRLKDVPLDD